MQRHVDNRFERVCIVLLAVVLACLPACSSGSASSLVGEYSTTDGGQAEFRITRVRGESFASVLKGGDAWTNPEKLVECSEKDYEDLFGTNWRDLKVRGLRASTGSFGIFRVQKGAVGRDHTFQTGYFMVFILGGADVYRL